MKPRSRLTAALTAFSALFGVPSTVLADLPLSGYHWEVDAYTNTDNKFTEAQRDALTTLHVPPANISYTVPLPGFADWTCRVAPEQPMLSSDLLAVGPDHLTPSRKIECWPTAAPQYRVHESAFGPSRSSLSLLQTPTAEAAQVMLTADDRTLTVMMRWVPDKPGANWLDDVWEELMRESVGAALRLYGCHAALAAHSKGGDRFSYSVSVRAPAGRKGEARATIRERSVGASAGPAAACVRDALDKKGHPYPGARERAVTLHFMVTPP